MYIDNLVSIITPAYNAQNHISHSIKSVLSQDYQHWELIIINDGSNDNTVKIIKHFQKTDKRIKLIQLDKNYGASFSRNSGIKIARGEYLAFLDSDDSWNNQKLNEQIKFMKNNSFYFSCTDYVKTIMLPNRSKSITIKARKKSTFNDLLYYCPGNSTVVFNQKVLGKFYSTNLAKRNDYILWLNVIKKAKYLYGLNTPLTIYRSRIDSLSSHKFSLIKFHWIIYYKIEKIGLFKSFMLINHWLLKGVINFLKDKL